MVTTRQQHRKHPSHAVIALVVCVLAFAVTSCQQVKEMRLGGINPLYENRDEDPLAFRVDTPAPDPVPSDLETAVVVKATPSEARFAELLKVASEEVAAGKDFHCVLVRRELVGDELQPQESLDFTQRFLPHALRLEWVGDRFKGRKMAYVKGEYNDKVRVRLASLAVRWRVLSFSTQSTVIKAYSRYTPDVAGYNGLVERLVRIHAAAKSAGKLSVQIAKPEVRAGRTRQRFDLVFKGGLANLDVSKMTVWFDLDTSLPVHTIIYDAAGRMVEDYNWRNIRLDNGFTDDDFKI